MNVKKTNGRTRFQILFQFLININQIEVFVVMTYVTQYRKIIFCSGVLYVLDCISVNYTKEQNII